MAGCAMIGQSVINVKSGGRGRLSTLVSGVFLMFLILVLGPIVVQIPMPILVGIMISVCIGTFDWGTVNYLKKAPKTDSIVMLATVAIVVYTHNLAIGVIVGVILSALFFVGTISKVKIHNENGNYQIIGPLFFASTQHFVQTLENAKENHIILDFSSSHLWDESAVGAIIKVVSKLEEQGKTVQLTGLNPASKHLYHQLTNLN